MTATTRCVLVTGASSGIGEATALRLARAGWRVLAGVRASADAERLRAAAGERLEPVTIDVTEPATIAAAAEGLGDEPLHGLVNNAGTALAMPLEFLPLDQFRRQLEVNLVGQVAVTQAVLPNLRSARGRIVNVGSIAGRSSLPFLGAYAASKHGLEAVTDALRVELRPFGITVTIVEPGTIATPIWRKGGELFAATCGGDARRAGRALRGAHGSLPGRSGGRGTARRAGGQGRDRHRACTNDDSSRRRGMWSDATRSGGHASSGYPPRLRDRVYERFLLRS